MHEKLDSAVMFRKGRFEQGRPPEQMAKYLLKFKGHDPITELTDPLRCAVDAFLMIAGNTAVLALPKAHRRGKAANAKELTP